VSVCSNCHGTECSSIKLLQCFTKLDVVGDFTDLMLDNDSDCVIKEVVECDQDAYNTTHLSEFILE
jgi:hypothetical protein